MRQLRRSVAACPKGARKALVSLADADEIIAEAAKHQLFYRNSGGGITFSGGEATAQPELLEYLSSRLYDMGFSLDIESCGYFEFERVRSSLERMDLIFMDLSTWILPCMKNLRAFPMTDSGKYQAAGGAFGKSGHSDSDD